MSYLSEHNRCGLSVGDRVRIIRAAKGGEKGWDSNFVHRITADVGKVGTITFDHGKHGFEVEVDDDPHRIPFEYPYFILEKIEP